MTRSGFVLPETGPCFYCDQISKNPVPGLIAESSACVTLVNARQHQEGQVVVIPKRHAPTIIDLEHEEALDIFRAARLIANAMVETYSMDGMLLYQNNGVASGQEVPHFHLHICPQRFASSRWGNEPPHIADALGREFRPDTPLWLGADQQNEVAEKLKAALARIKQA